MYPCVIALFITLKFFPRSQYYNFWLLQLVVGYIGCSELYENIRAAIFVDQKL